MLLLHSEIVRASQSLYSLHHVQTNTTYILMVMDGRCWLHINDAHLSTDMDAILNFMRLGFADGSPVISDWVHNTVLQNETVKAIVAAADPSNLKISSLTD